MEENGCSTIACELIRFHTVCYGYAWELYGLKGVQFSFIFSVEPVYHAGVAEQNADVFATAAFTTDLVQVGDDTLYGTLTCDLLEKDGKTVIISLHNSMVSLTPCREEPILTPEQAIERLQAGYSSVGKQLELCEENDVEVRSYTLDWNVDTKGFYQPVYRIVF